MKIKNTVLLFFVMVSVSAYSMEERSYSRQEKQYYLEHQVPVDHPWFNKSRDDHDVTIFPHARYIVAKRMAVETVFKNKGFTHIKLPQAMVRLFDKNYDKRNVQSEDEITPEFTRYFLQENIKHDNSVRLNAGQAEELSTLFRCVYLHESDIAVTKNGLYIALSPVNGEHFATSWQKIWFRGLQFNEEAIEVFNRKQIYLQGYVIKCLKQYKKDNPEKKIADYRVLPLLPEEDEVEIEGTERIYRMPLYTALTHLFANDVQHDAFWRQIEEE